MQFIETIFQKNEKDALPRKKKPLTKQFKNAFLIIFDMFDYLLSTS